jgi:hypothetical protein
MLRPAAHEAVKKKVPETVGACFDLIERKMFRGPWAMGDAYMIDDPYLFLWATARRRLGSARRSSAIRAQSRSRWPRSRFRRTCSLDWTEARRPILSPRARRGTMEPAKRLRKSPIPTILAVVGGGIRRMSAWRFAPSTNRLRRGDGRRDAAIADFRRGWQFRVCACGQRRRQQDSGAPS